MTTQVANLSADLTANTSRFQAGMQQADAVMNNSKTLWTRDLQSIAGEFNLLGLSISNISELLLAGFSVSKILGDLDNVIEMMNNVGKAADRLGLDTTFLSGLSYGAKQAGIDLDTLTKDLKNMEDSVVKAEQSGNTKAFTNIGIDFAAFQKLNPQAQLLELADAFDKVTNAEVKNNSANAIFGKQGTMMLTVFQGGSAAIEQMIEKATGLGLVFSRDDAEGAEKFNTALVDLHSVYDGLLISFAKSGAMEDLTDLLDLLAKNLYLVEDAALIVGGVLVGRLAASVYEAAASFVLAAKAELVFRDETAIFAGVTVDAAIGMNLMAVSAGLLKNALALLGGPVGLLAIAAFAAFEYATKGVDKAQGDLGVTLDKVRQIDGQLYVQKQLSTKQLEDDRQKILDDATARIANAQAIIAQTEAQGDWYKIMLKGANQGSGIDTTDTANLKAAQASLKAIQEQIASDQKKAGTQGNIPGNNQVNEEKIKQAALAQKSIYDTEALNDQQLLALNQETNAQYIQQKIGLNDKLEDLEVQAATDRRDSIEGDTVAYEKANTEILAIQEKYNNSRLQLQNQLDVELQKDYLKLGEDINNSLVDSIAEFANGTKSAKDAFHDFTTAVEGDLIKLASKNFVEAVFGDFTGASGAGGGLGGSIAGLFSSLSSSGSTGGDGGGIGSSISSFFDALPSFDVGTNYVPHDMIAQIHKGEAIVPEAYNDGGGSSTPIQVNIINNAGAKVSSNSQQQNGTTSINVMIDQAIADNISSPGSKTNQALTAFSNRTTVKR